MAEKTKMIFNQGRSPYTYRDPADKKVKTLMPNGSVELPTAEADRLLFYSKDIIDTASKHKPSAALDETTAKLEDANAKITELTIKLQKALDDMAAADKVSKDSIADLNAKLEDVNSKKKK
jgi:ABC-type transporter Mla subunit MlaD